MACAFPNGVCERGEMYVYALEVADTRRIPRPDGAGYCCVLPFGGTGSCPSVGVRKEKRYGRAGARPSKNPRCLGTCLGAA